VFTGAHFTTVEVGFNCELQQGRGTYQLFIVIADNVGDEVFTINC